MPLQNINYDSGQDGMDDVFDKTNACINAVNEFVGGTANQFPIKDDGTDFNVSWTDGLVSTGSVTFSTGWANAFSGTSVKLIIGGWVEFNGLFTISTGGTTTVGTITAPYRPIVNKRFVIEDYNGSDGGTGRLILNIATTGEITLFTASEGAKPSNRDVVSFTVNYNIL